MHRLFPVLILIASTWCGIASAEEQASTPPKTVSKPEQITALDPATEAVTLRYRKGLLKALVARCPAIERLTISSDGTIPLDEVKSLVKLASLRELLLLGDMSFPKSHFEVVGTIQTIRSLHLGLP